MRTRRTLQTDTDYDSCPLGVHTDRPCETFDTPAVEWEIGKTDNKVFWMERCVANGSPVVENIVQDRTPIYYFSTYGTGNRKASFETWIIGYQPSEIWH